MGQTVFRTECPFCQACEPVRVDVAAFSPSRSQRRVLARNADLRLEIGTPSLTRRRVALWNRHRRARGLLTSYSRKDPVGYQEWLVESCAPTIEVRYYEGDRLCAVSILDMGVTSANSAYHYYDPADQRRSMGVYSVLREIEVCASLGIRWYYLGLWASDAAALRYKSTYYPHERLIRGAWTPFATPAADPATDDPYGYARDAGAVRTPGLAMATMAPMLSDPAFDDDSEGRDEE